MTCAKFNCDWLNMLRKRTLQNLIEFRIHLKYCQWDGCQVGNVWNQLLQSQPFTRKVPTSSYCPIEVIIELAEADSSFTCNLWDGHLDWYQLDIQVYIINPVQQATITEIIRSIGTSTLIFIAEIQKVRCTFISTLWEFIWLIAYTTHIHFINYKQDHIDGLLYIYKWF